MTVTPRVRAYFCYHPFTGWMISGANIDSKPFHSIVGELLAASDWQVVAITFEYDGQDVSTLVLLLPNTRLDDGRKAGVDHAARRLAELIAPELIARWKTE